MAIDYDKEYDTRGRVPDAADILGRMAKDAATYRTQAVANKRAELDVRYGETPREIVDIFFSEAGPDAPLAIFIHGGYWRALQPSAFSQVAAGLNAHGVTVALPGYNLCPQVGIGDIVEEMRRAALYLHKRFNKCLLVLGHSAGTRFVFALALMTAVGIAGWLNFALLERPMTEVVGDSYRVMGVPIYRLAALAIIVLEVAVGMVLLEALGGTTMFPQFEAIEHRRGLKLAIVVTMTTALFVLAAIEATLALTRDDLSRLERELMGTLANSAPSETAQSVGQIARYAQAAFGFVIPFAMAFLGFAIEMLVRNGRVVAQVVIAELLKLLAFLLRLLRGITVGLMTLVVALYDFAIFLPLAIEALVKKLRSRPSPGAAP